MIRAALAAAGASVAFFVLVVLTAGLLHLRLGADPSLTVGLVAAELAAAVAIVIKWSRS